MNIIKRNGKLDEVKFDKISQRIKSHSKDLQVDSATLTQKVISGIYNNIKAQEIDNLLSDTAAAMSIDHPDYGTLAARIVISSLHKETNPSFYQTSKLLYKEGILSDQYIEKVRKYSSDLDKIIDFDRDFTFDYFGFKTLERSYLLKINKKIVERPQHLWMRVAVEVCDELPEITQLYNLLSLGYYTHATPTLFNAGTKSFQGSSCFLFGIEDSIDGIYDCLKTAAKISKHAGGIGIHISNIRSKGSYIKGNNGFSDGLVPMAKVFNETARYVNQGSKRKGSIALYLEPWHADIFDFLDLKKNTGKEELRARDIFTAVFINDLFFQRVKDDKDWTLMCPNECPGLTDVYGEEFVKLYEKYESEGRGRKTIKASELMAHIIESQIETGVPYIVNKDQVNLKSNQKNIGVVKSSNLCSEILEVSDLYKEHGLCNLSSIALPKFVNEKDKTFDFDKLIEVARVATRNLNHVIDKNFYPTEPGRFSNLKNRPIGLGVQGLQDVYFKLRIPFDSEEAKELNKKIFAHIYYGALEESIQLAKEQGPYESYEGSPASQGILQFDMWNTEPHPSLDWNKLKKKLKKYGLRNSLLCALMPTASTAQVLGNTECFEPISSNIYKRATLAGEFPVINKYLVKDLIELNLWTPEIKDKIIKANGSIQNVDEIPQELKDLYKTVWEISQRVIIDQAADRGVYIDQSQSMNLFFNNPTFGKINTALFHAWSKGLKTLNYYIRTKTASDAIKISTSIKKEEAVEQIACSIENKEDCMSCGS